MKKFIAKFRLVLNLWSLKQQIRVSEAFIDQIEKDLTSARDMASLIKEFVKEPVIGKKIQKLEAEKKVHVETVAIYRRRALELQKELTA